MTRALLISLWTVTLVAQPVAAQISFELGPVAYFTERFTKSGLPLPGDPSSCCRVLSETGTWFGAEGSVRYANFSLTVSGIAGELTEKEFNTATDESLRFSRISLQLHPTTWLAFGPDIDVWRSIRLRDGVPRERLIRRFGWGITLSGTLGLPGLRVVANGAFYPLATAQEALLELDYENQWRNGFNSRVSAALEYAPERAPVFVRVAFREERWFTRVSLVTDDSENDHLRGLLASAGIRLRPR